MQTGIDGKRAFAGAALAALALWPCAASAQSLNDVRPSKPLVLKGQGSFFIDGNTHFVATPTAVIAGNSMINQMYVQFQKPADRTHRYPIVFVHGCCLSSKTWETTPDGRMGWYEYFTRRGFDTYMADQVARARSGFDATTFNQVRQGTTPPAQQPPILIATDQFAWQVFRWGTYATLTPFPDERFPMQTVGVGSGSSLTFYSQVIPDENATLSGTRVTGPGFIAPPTDPAAIYATPASLAKLSNQLDGAILVGHSESSSFPTTAVLQPGSKGIKGIIQLETGCFGNLTADNIAVLKKVPILIVEGDHYATARPVEPCPTEMNQITAAGGDITYIHIPDLGIFGNSHMFMQDNNNLQIADILIDWIDKHVKGSKIDNGLGRDCGPNHDEVCY